MPRCGCSKTSSIPSIGASKSLSLSWSDASGTRWTRFRDSVAAANRNTLILMASSAAALMLVALLLGFVISWSFILPVQKAHGFLSEVAKGNFAATINVPNRDEFGALAAHMNHMSQELHRLYESQNRASQELQRLNEQLQQASKAKSNFLANMSHELRTPMNAILGFVEMMLDEIYGEVPPHLREPLTDVQTNGKHLLRLINDVLDLSKIEAGRMELVLAEYSVQDVVETVRTSLQSLALEKGLEFVAAAEDDIPLALGDGKRITQCLMNLVGNALKFSKHGTRGGLGRAARTKLALSRVGYRNRHTSRKSSKISLRNSNKWTRRSRGSSVGPDSGLTSPRNSSKCMAAGFGWKASSERDRLFSLPFLCA